MWKDVIGYEGLYQVSDEGQVRSYGKYIQVRPNCTIYREGKILWPEVCKNGYLRVQLYKDNSRNHKLIHRLVAEAFIPNPNNLETVNHKNENKQDNSIDNLEWMSAVDNIRYGTGIQRKSSSKKRPVKQLSLEGELIRVWDSARDAEAELGIKNSSICSCCRGKQKTAGNFKWEYDN